MKKAISLNRQNHKYYSTDKTVLRKPAKIMNDFYVETNLCANDFAKRISEILNQLGMKTSEITIYLRYEKQTDLFASNDAHGVYMLVYEEETGKIIKACMNVFNELGNGFLEAVYQEALAIEFGLMKIPFQKEAKIDIYYKGNKLNKEYYADFICYDKIIVELKCVSKLVNANKAQVINYLHGTHFAVGLLVNFGESSLKWERLTLLKNSEDR